MGKVILHATMSLDGFIAGPNDEMDWVFEYWAQSPDKAGMGDEVMDQMGAVVLGKRTYDISVATNHMPYGGTIKVPQFVVTHDAHEPVTQDGLTFTFVTDGIESAVTQAKAAAGDKNVSLLGASIDQQCIQAGLVDEFVIHLAPILLNKGIRLFDKLGAERIKLEKIAVGETAQITDLRFRVVK